MKKLLGCICALLMLAGLAVPLAAATFANEAELAPADDLITVTGARLENGHRLFLYEKGAPVETLTAQLDTVAYLLPLQRPFAVCAITWDTAGCDLATTGRKTLRGLVAVPDTHAYLVNGQPAELWVAAEIMVYENGMPATEAVLPNSVGGRGSPVLVPLGSGPESLDSFMAESDYLATLETADELIIYTRASFDPALVDLDKAGWYFGFVYDLPSCFVVAQNDPSRADVVVLRDDIVDLTYTFVGQHSISSEWFYGAYEPALWVARDVEPEDLEAEAVWTPVPENDEKGDSLYRFGTTLPEGSAKSMDISLYYFLNAYGDAYAPGTYYFQVRHRDGVSNIACVKVAGGQFTVELPGGDKDGGDADDEDPPTIEQPPPDPEQPTDPEKPTDPEQPTDPEEPIDPEKPVDPKKPKAPGAAGQAEAITGLGGTPEAVPVVSTGTAGMVVLPGGAGVDGVERSTPTETTVAGLRLREMMALQGERVLFQKDGISVRFDTAFLETLCLDDQDFFTVTLEPLEGQRYRIGTAVNGVALERIPGTRVELWHSAPAGLRVVDEQGGELPDVTCDEALGRVTFAVDAPGIYTLLVPEGAAPPPPVQAAVDTANTVNTGGNGVPGWGIALAVCGVGLPAAGVAGGLWRRRAKARSGNTHGGQ